MMKTKRFDFNYRPLQINVCLAVDGSVPGQQNYDVDTAAYTPDYTITPLVLQPAVSMMDRDEILQPGKVNSKLANVRWFEIAAGTRKLIDAANSAYEITTSGDNAGRIKVKRNAEPQQPLTLEFNAEFADTRTSQIHCIRRTYLLRCGNATQSIPVLVLDAAEQTVYNPFRDTDKQVVRASLKLGTRECEPAKRIFVWEVLRDDGTWSAVGTDTTLDYDLVVSSDGLTCMVDRSLMGAELHLRCRAKYSPSGNPAAVPLTDASPSKEISFIRRIPKYEYDITALPTNISPGVRVIAPEAKVWDGAGIIQNPESELLPVWMIATNKAAGNLDYKQVAHGMSPSITTDAIDGLMGGVVALDMTDCGPAAAWEDSDGAVFEDNAGLLILIK